MAIQLATAGVNVPRDAHYELNPVTGLYERCLLLEDTRTNNLAYSTDFSNGVWVKATVSVTTGVLDPAGGTSAQTLTATAANSEVRQTLAAGASAQRAGAMWVRRRTGAGTIALINPDGLGTTVIVPTANWQRFLTAVPAANTARQSGVLILASGDAIDVWNGQQEDAAFPTSDIITGATALARGVDSFSLPFPIAPREMTVYARVYERGTGHAVNTRYFEIAAVDDSSPRFLLYNGNPYPTLFHAQAGGAVFLNSGIIPAVGQLVEWRCILYADGSIQLGQSINGGAEVLSARSAALPMGPAWSAPTLWLNSAGTPVTGTTGFAAFAAVKVLLGVQSLATMQAA